MPKDETPADRQQQTDGTPNEAAGAAEARAERLRARRRRRRERRISPLTRRILLVNVVAILIPVVGLINLGPYRDGLIDQELEALKTQGEIFSGAIGEGAIEVLENGDEVMNLVPARQMIRRLSGPTNVRARLFQADGAMVADSRQLGTVGAVVEVEELPEPGATTEIVNPVVDFVEDMADLIDEGRFEPYRDPPEPSAEDFPEAQQALTGTAAERVRVGDEGGLVLTVALPVQRYYQVKGALMLTKTGEEIGAAMREVRLAIALIFAGALVVTVLLSLYLAGTIAQPVRRLAEAAERVRRTVGRESPEMPDFSDREDEIGDLATAFAEMTDALQARLVAIERFAADVAHEIKNPLTSLRSAVETAARVKEPEQQQRLMAVIQDDVERLDRLISDISDASRLDAELSRSEAGEIDLAGLLEALAEMRAATMDEEAGADPVRVTFEPEGDGPFLVRGMEDRLVQVLRNLIGNAESFSPPGGTIVLGLRRHDGRVEIAIEDEGPGIPDTKLTAIFDRFYSERPETEKFGTHSGLGLSISKRIVEAHHGRITAENRTDDRGRVLGARFTIALPVASESD